MPSRTESDNLVIQDGSTNVYADLGYADAEAMLIKAGLANSMAAIIKRRRWTQQKAAGVMGITQPKLSGILNGRFRGVSEAKLIECLAALGSDVEITIHGPHRPPRRGRITVSMVV
ncbi:MAG: helix-turn-helix domain-containing protein [Ottowia sp.]|nr:helix-turn-helix domain-containing protein [Ottowia sp.]